MNKKLIAICAIIPIFFGAEPISKPSTVSSSSIGTDVVIIGDLGVPVGQDVTISGFKKTTGPLTDMFVVEAINGKKAGADLRIRVNGITDWPEKTTATLRGYEVGTLRFIHLADTNYGQNDKRWKGPHQVLYVSFEVSKVVAPSGLEIKAAK